MTALWIPEKMTSFTSFFSNFLEIPKSEESAPLISTPEDAILKQVDEPIPKAIISIPKIKINEAAGALTVVQR